MDNSSDTMSVFGKNLIFFRNFSRMLSFFHIGLLFIAIYHFLAKKDQSSFFTKYILDVIFDYFYSIFCLFSSVFFLNPSGRLSFLGLTFFS